MGKRIDQMEDVVAKLAETIITLEERISEIENSLEEDNGILDSISNIADALISIDERLEAEVDGIYTCIADVLDESDPAEDSICDGDCVNCSEANLPSPSHAEVNLSEEEFRILLNSMRVYMRQNESHRPNKIPFLNATHKLYKQMEEVYNVNFDKVSE